MLNLFTPLPIHFQFNVNTNTERVNSLNVFFFSIQIINVLHCLIRNVKISKQIIQSGDAFIRFTFYINILVHL